MTVRRSLFLSNILMIFVPVIAAALTGLFCVGVIWLSVVGGAGLDLHDAEDFNRVCLAVTEIIEHNLDSKANLTSLNVLLEDVYKRQVYHADLPKIYFVKSAHSDSY